MTSTTSARTSSPPSFAARGYEVHDLGLDVPPENFTAALKEIGAGLFVLPGLLTMAFDAMKGTLVNVTGAGLRDKVKVIIGGGPVNEKVVEYSGVDAFGFNAPQALKLADLYLA